MTRRLPFFYGWAIVAAAFVVLTTTAGLGFYNASVILSAAKNELDVSVGTVSLGPTLFFGISGITGFVLSKRMVVADIRWFYLTGGIVGSAALFGLRAVDSVFTYYLFFAFFGVGFSLAGLVPSTTLVARWFSVNRSIALSISSTGLSVGGILLTPLAERLIKDQTLAGASSTLSMMWLLGVVPISLLVFRSDPSELGLQPDGAPTPAIPVAPEGATLGEATDSRFFRFSSATFALIFQAQVGGIAHLYNLATERIGDEYAARVISILALSSVIGRLAGGVVVTRLPTMRMTSVLTLVQAAALGLIAFADSRETIYLGAAIFGLSVGNLLMLQPLLVAEAFGVKEYSRVYSLTQLISTFGIAGGPFLIGAIHDITDYRMAFVVVAIGNVIGYGFLLAAGSIDVPRAIWATGPARTPAAAS